jgi:hypothetical protein
MPPKPSKKNPALRLPPSSLASSNISFETKEAPKYLLFVGEILCYIVGVYRIAYFGLMIWVREHLNVTEADGITQRPCVFNCGVSRWTLRQMVNYRDGIKQFHDDGSKNEQWFNEPFDSDGWLQHIDNTTIANAFMSSMIAFFVGYLARTIRLNW